MSSNDEPVIQIVNQLLATAVETNASDVHFELYENTYRIRMRVDGILQIFSNPAEHLAARMIARLKILANLDITEKRLPQDGRFTLTLLGEQKMEFRVSTCPMIHGEKVVVRLLQNESAIRNLGDLGLSEKQLENLLQALNKPQGLILVTGPTGSGKSATLYSAISYLNQIEKNLLTIEDPVEIILEGVNQVNVNCKIGLSFPVALRAFLRQDPDVIMIGEIRDFETAEIAVKAAQTGHLVLASLHANNTTEAITRLLHLGIPKLQLAFSLSLIIAQRLVRRLCPYCRKLISHNPCPSCVTGYKGRTGIFELLPINKPFRAMILNDRLEQNFFSYLQKNGIQSLYQAGLDKIKDGQTHLQEVNRVTVDV